MITAEYDVTRDATEDYARRLHEAGVTTVATRYAGVAHGFYTMLGVIPEAEQALRQTVEFIQDHL